MDPHPTFLADADPNPHQSHASSVSVHDPPWLHFDPPQLLSFDFDADLHPDPAFDFNANPYPTFRSDADPDPNAVSDPQLNFLPMNCLSTVFTSPFRISPSSVI
jgi:hypothetical protein